jgi:hypothetical protein
MRLLRKETNRPDPVLKRFEGEAYADIGTGLMGLELSERV